MPPTKKLPKGRPATPPKLGRPHGTPDPDSRVSRIARLPVGECESCAKRVEIGNVDADERMLIRKNLGSTLHAAGLRAAKQLDSQFQFTVETFQHVTDTHYVLTGVLTRTA